MTKIISKRGRVGGQSKLSRDQQDEIIKCAGDPLYFMRRHIRIPQQGSPRSLILQSHHCEFVVTLKHAKNVIAMLPRSTGMTSMSLAFVLWEVLFKPRHRAIAFGISSTFTKDMYEILTHMISHVPAFLRPTLKSNRKSYIEFDNGSSISVEVLTVSSMKGRTINRVYLDSFAFAPDAIQRAIYNDICPVIILGGSVLMASTPNGQGNAFAQAWKDSFKPFTSFTSFRRTIDDLPFTDLWKQKMQAMIGMAAWKQNYMCEFI